MNTSQHWRKPLVGLLFLALTLCFGTTYAQALSLAANTQITNTVTVNYNNAAGAAQTAVESSVTIKVNLVAAAPTISTPADQNTTESTAATLTYTITSNANGPDDYALAQTIAEVDALAGTNLSGESSVSFLPVSPIALGGTTIAVLPAENDTTIVVPYDADYDTDSASVNGITQDDILVINGNEYVVDSISEDAVNNQTTITLTTGLSAADAAWAAVGTQIGERQTFALNFTTGDLTDPTVVSWHAVTVTGTSSNTGAGTQEGTSLETKVYVQRGNLTVSKQVSINDADYFASTDAIQGVDPGTTLIYRITITNNGTGNATSVIATDPLPDYTTYVGEAKADTSVTTYAVAAETLTDADDVADGYDWNVTDSDTVTYDIGSIPSGGPNNVRVFFFKVKVDPNP